jgi:CHAD domain-containing protein/HD superfamily phosphodiesterase
MHASLSPSTRAQKTTGLRYWMLRVLEECENVSAGFSPDAVHDLRISLRRCRSMADGLMAIDPDPGWKAMKKAGKRLFQRLGALRDIHVMQEWVEKLEKAYAEPALSSASAEPSQNLLPAGETNSADSPARTLLNILKDREAKQKLEAQAVLEEFDRKQWKRWSKSLPARAARVRPGSALFKHLALERWTEARALHARALRNRSQTAFHSLRIGIKRFRYIVENFLPVEHKAWSDDLKEVQDLLGEVHDLDVLWSTAISCRVFPDEHSRQRWHEQILSQRSKRIERYRAKMIGENSLWQVWRAALPQGKQVQELATRRMKLWASHLDPDFPHSELVANLALQLFEGLLGIAWRPAIDAGSARFSLRAAALLHDVGKSEGEKNHHKKSFKLVQSHGKPLGWKAADFDRAAIVARFHRGSLPTRRHKLLRGLLPDEQKAAIQLSAILRLANALDASHDSHIRRLKVRTDNPSHQHHRARLGSIIVAAEGFSARNDTARIVAAERYLLETILRRPVLIRRMLPTADGTAVSN